MKMNLDEFKIEKLYIDDSAMTDEKMGMIIDCLVDQKGLRSIVLMNCHL